MPRVPVLLVLASSAVLAGAGPCDTSEPTTTEPPVETVVRPTQSRGTVSGRVMDFLAGAPAADVTVTLLVGGETFPTQQTAADGTFSFAEVPAGGETSVLMEKAGFEPVLQTVTIPAAAGNFPTETAVAFVGPIHLLSTAGTFSVRVLLPDGSPAEGFTALARLPAAWVTLNGTGVPQARGLLLRSTTTITNGVASFGAIPDLGALAQRFPDLQLTVTIGAPVVNNVPVAAGLEKSWRLGDLLALGTLATQTVVLSGYDPGEDLKIIASNLPDLVDGRTVQLPGTVEPGDGNTDPGIIRVMFNQPVAPESLDVVLVDERGRAIPSGPTSLTRPTVLQTRDGGMIPPLTEVDIQLPLLDPGAENNLLITAKPVADRGRRSWGRAIYTAQQARAIQVLAVKRITQHAPDMDGSVDERLFPGDRFHVDLIGAVGGRKADGTPVAAADFRPVVVQVVGTYFDNGINPLASFITTCTLAEPAVPPPYTLGGFTTRVACTVPTQGVVPPDVPLPPMTPSFTEVTVTFNDSAARDDRPTPGTVTVTTPDGAVALTATNSLPLPLLND